MARERFDFDDGYIAAGDLCIINVVDRSTGYCSVTYPTGGGNDVFYSSQKDKRVPITWFVEYQPTFKMQRLTVPAGEQYQVYPLASRETYGRTWYLDPGDEYYTVAQANGLTEVLYYCTRGVHEGWWKLGWVDLPYYSLDLNGWLDGAESGDLGSYGAADVYVNGNLLVQYARDFYSANGTFPRGSTYEIKNIVASSGYTYNGVHSGSASGTLTDNTKVYLDFTKNPVNLEVIRMVSNPSKLEYLEGDELDTSGMKVEAVNSDGTTSDVTGQCSLSGYDGTPGVKTVDVTYGGKSTAFTVVVRSKTPTQLAVTSLPTKTTYNVNEEVSLDGLQVTATFDNGTTEIVDDYEVLIDEGTTASAGAKTISVFYAYNEVEVGASFEITVTGQGSDNPPAPSDGLTLSVVADDQVVAGETFDVNLYLSNNEGIASLKVKVAFDSNLLELTKVTYNGAMGGMSQQPQRKTPPVTLNWFNGAENFVGDATYATLTFTAIGVSGSNASVELTYNPNDVYDITETNVALSVVNKTIAIGGGNAPVPQPGLYDKDGWVDLGDGRKGYALGGKLVTGWLSVGDAKYYFHDGGVMATGWTDLELDGKVMHYYFNPASGNLARGTWMTIDGAKYYFRPSGNVAHGWATISDAGVDKKYYFDDDFQLVTGWRDIDTGQGYAGHYYFRPSGSMATDWATIDGQKYWFRPSGNMATGFADVDDEFKRYFDADGHMLTGWQRISGKTYYFRPSGAMQTGEKTIDGTTYTFSEKGVLVGIAGSASTVAASALRGVVGLLASADELAATSGEDAAAANEDEQRTDAPLEMADEDEPLPDEPEDDSNPDVSQLDDGDESAEG